MSYPKTQCLASIGAQFYRGFVVIPTDLILRSKYLWIRLWIAFALTIPNSR
ncbi:hypothetical protein ACO1KB_18585 [Leptospira interrogans serovar Szwajizak]|uniref:hypothetical protein n=1 Tax=Leptospira interrogans TaxID=173 RepID=UPI00034B6644|nr:hypothetical protein [Leptospira interrogans]